MHAGIRLSASYKIALDGENFSIKTDFKFHLTIRTSEVRHARREGSDQNIIVKQKWGTRKGHWT